MVVAVGVMGCGKGGAPASGGSGSAAAGSSALLAGSPAAACDVKLDASCAKPSDAGAALDAAAAPADPVDVSTLPDTEATNRDQKVKAGFGDSPSIFDPTPEKLAELTIAVVDPHDKVLFKKTGFAAIAGAAQPPGECEELRVIAARETWGEVSGARVSLICTNGEDDKTASETAILLAIEPPTARVLWAGDADTDHNYMDACMESHAVTFTVHGKTLTKSISDTTRRGTDAPKDCKKRSKKRSETVTLP